MLTGRVTSLTTYGAFVDLGGIEGMLHVSEIGHSRTAHPQDVFQVGQEVEVQVIKIEKGKDEKRPERISLSRRALEKDPWQRRGLPLPRGDGDHRPRDAHRDLRRLRRAGARPRGAGPHQRDGRRPAAEPRPRGGQPGQEVQVRVLGVDTARRRISLSMGTRRRPAAAVAMTVRSAGAVAAEGIAATGEAGTAHPERITSPRAAPPPPRARRARVSARWRISSRAASAGRPAFPRVGPPTPHRLPFPYFLLFVTLRVRGGPSTSSQVAAQRGADGVQRYPRGVFESRVTSLDRGSRIARR